MKVFGASATAREAAIAYAEYRASPRELPCAPPRAPRDSRLMEDSRHRSKVVRVKKLEAQMYALLGYEEGEEGLWLRKEGRVRVREMEPAHEGAAPAVMSPVVRLVVEDDGAESGPVVLAECSESESDQE